MWVNADRAVVYNRFTSTKVPFSLLDNIQCESRKTYGPPFTVTGLLPLCTQMYTGTATALTAGTHLCTRTQLCAVFRLVELAR